MTGSPEVSILSDFSQLTALEADWWDLWRRSLDATPFQSPAWLLPWWQIFKPGELRVVTIRHQGRLAALAPFYLEKSESRCRLLPLGIGISDYLDILLDAERAAATTDLLARAFASLPDRWREWEIPELSSSAAAHHFSCPPECREEEGGCSCCPVLSIAESAQVSSVLPRRKLRKLRMADRRARQKGEISVLSADRRNLATLLSRLVALSHQRHASKAEACVFDDLRVVDFHRKAAPLLLQAGLLRLNALMLGPDMAAVYYGLYWNRRAYAYLSAFDGAYERESPGSLLIAHAIGQAIAEGAREFDFLRGDEAYKSEWGAAPRVNRRRVFHRQSCHADA